MNNKENKSEHFLKPFKVSTTNSKPNEKILKILFSKDISYINKEIARKTKKLKKNQKKVPQSGSNYKNKNGQ